MTAIRAAVFITVVETDDHSRRSRFVGQTPSWTRRACPSCRKGCLRVGSGPKLRSSSSSEIAGCFGLAIRCGLLCHRYGPHAKFPTHSCDLSHDDLARRHQRPEQHGGCLVSPVAWPAQGAVHAGPGPIARRRSHTDRDRPCRRLGSAPRGDRSGPGRERRITSKSDLERFGEPVTNHPKII